MFNLNTFSHQYKKKCFPIYKPIHFPIIFPNQMTIPKINPIDNSKIYMIVTTNDDYVTDNLILMDIEILDKTCAEEYRIFLIKCSEYKTQKLKKYNWCINISRGT